MVSLGWIVFQGVQSPANHHTDNVRWILGTCIILAERFQLFLQFNLKGSISNYLLTLVAVLFLIVV